MAEVLDAPVEAVDGEQQQDTLGFRPAKSSAPADDLGFRPSKAAAEAPTPVADAPLELPVTVPNPTFPNAPAPAPQAQPSDMPQVRAYEPSVGRQVWNTIANSAVGRSLQSTMPKFAAGIGLAPTEALQSPTYAQHGDQILAPEYVKDAVSEILGFRKRGEPAQAPTPGQNRVEGALDAAGKITSGESLATIGGTSIAAALTAGVINPASAHVLSRLIAGGFTGDMLYGLYKQNKEYKKAVDAGDTATAQKIQGEMGVNGIMATLGALHTAGVGPHAETTSGAYGERGARVGFGNAATAELGFRPAYRAPAPEGGYGEGSSVVPGKVTGAVTVGGKRFGTTPTVPAPTPEPIPPKELTAGAAAAQATAAHPDMAPAMEQATNEPQPVGAEDPDSKRTIVQPTNNPAVNQAMATAAMPKFTADLDDAIKAVPGATVAATREEKNPQRLAEKINGEGKPAETIGDYGATQISVKSPEDRDAAVAAIKAKFPVVSEDDNFEKGDKDFGYRSHSLQVQTPTGGTMEVQIVPKEVFEANPEEHGNYKTAREARITGNDTEFARQAQEAKAKNDAAMAKFEKRNGIESGQEKPSAIDSRETKRAAAGTLLGELGGEKSQGSRIDAPAESSIRSNAAIGSTLDAEKRGEEGEGGQAEQLPGMPSGNSSEATSRAPQRSFETPRGPVALQQVPRSRSTDQLIQNGGRGESPEQPKAVGTETPAAPVKIEKGSNVVLPDGTAGTVKWTMGGKARVTTADGKQLPNVAVKDLKPAPAAAEHVDTAPIGNPIPKRVEQIKQEIDKGTDVRIFTARVANDPEGKARAEVERFSEQNLGRRLPVTNEKDDNLAYILDNKANVAQNANEPFDIPEIPKGKWLGVDLDGTIAEEHETEAQTLQGENRVREPAGTGSGEAAKAEPVPATATEPARSGEGTGAELGSSKPASPVEAARDKFAAKRATAKEVAASLQAKGKDVKVASELSTKPAPANDRRSAHEKLADFMGGVAKRLAMESYGQGVLDDMEEAGESPRDINRQFWNDVYYELPAPAQELFQKQVKALTGMQPGDVIATDKDRKAIIAQDWQDVADADGKAGWMPKEVANLEGGERGYVSLMRDAIRRFEESGKLKRLEDAGQSPMFSLTGPTWYLKSEKLIDQKMRGPMTGDQVLRMLENGGVKADELKWTGLPEFLKGKFRVTPEQVKQQLADGGLKIKEVVKPEPRPTEWKTYPGGIMYTPDGYTIERLATNGRYRLDTPAGMAETFATPEEAKAQVDKYRSNTRADTEETKYSQYQLPGGENYRELLLTLPENRGKPLSTEERTELDGLMKQIDKGKLSPTDRRFTELYARYEDRPSHPRVLANQFKSGHWDEPNILAHIRFNDRTTPDGKRLLHIEEIQSDWHQKGRDKGYQNPDAKQQALKKLEDAEKAYQTADKAWWSGEKTAEEKAKLFALDKARNDLRDDYNALDKQGMVPDAPFKKDWHEMAFRRAVRYAAENGYDGVSWTPGEKQAERYDLSKQVSEVRYRPATQHFEAFDKSGSPMADATVPPEKLSDYIGKDAARKLLETEPESEFGRSPQHVLKGEGLKVGGEGMKGFYDKIIPDYARKFGKQWGAKVGEAELSTPETNGDQDSGRLAYEVYDPDGWQYDAFPTRELAEAAARDNGEGYTVRGPDKMVGLKVPVLDITPEMRKSVVQQGVPLFNRNPEYFEQLVQAQGATPEESLEKATYQKVTDSEQPHMLVDAHGFMAISNTLGVDSSWAALAWTKEQADTLSSILGNESQSPGQKRLAVAINENRDRYGSVVVVTPFATPTDIREERAHSWQFGEDLQPNVIREVHSDESIVPAMEALSSAGYNVEDPRILVAEATAKAMVDPTFLDAEKRSELLRVYAQALRREGVEFSNAPSSLPEARSVQGERNAQDAGTDRKGNANKLGTKEDKAIDAPEDTGTLFSRSPDATGDRDESEPLRDLVDRIKAQKAEKRNLLDRFKKESQRSIDSLKGGASAVARGLASIKGISAAAWDSYRRPPAWTDFKDATGKFQAAEQFADHAMNEFADEIKRVVPDKAQREAMTNWVEADGKDGVLKTRAASLRDLAKNVLRWKDKQSIPAPWMETVSKVVMNAEATGKSLADVAKKLDSMAKGYDLARELSPEEKKLSGHIREYLDAQLDNAIKSGLISHSFWQNYITHIYEGDTRGIQALINFGELAPNPAFIKKRVFATYFEGEMFGMMPRDKDIGYLTAAYHDAFTKALASRAYIGSLLEGKASDGRPLAILGSRGRWVQLNPDQMVSIQEQRKRPDSLGDYRTVDHPALRNWNWELTDKDAEEVSPKLFDDPEKALAIQGDLLLHPEVAGKVANILGKSAIAANVVGKAALKVSTTLKQSLLSFSGFHQTQEGLHAMEHKILPAKMPDLDFDNPTQRALVEHGLVVANFDGQSAFSEGVSSTELTQHIPLIGNLLHSYQDYLFRSYIPRLKMAMATHALQRNRMRYRGKLNDDQILEMTANQANAAFGGLNYKMMGRNKTFQDLLRLVLLAPDFLEARARFASQATKPFGQEQRSALLRGALIFYAIARILNAILNDGDMKLEPSMAFSVTYKGHKVGLRTVQGDILRLATDPRSFAFNRLNPMTTRPAVEFITGRDQFGRQKDVGSQAKDYLKSAVPIPAQGYLNNMDTTWPESIANALGLETGKYRSPAEQEAFRQHLLNIPDKPEDEDKIAESRQNKKLEDKLRDGRMTSAELWDMVGPGKPLTPKQAGDITKRAANAPIVNYAKNLSIEQMIPVFEKANVAERDLLRPELYKKSAELANRPEKERAKLQSQLDRLLEEDQKYQAKR